MTDQPLRLLVLLIAFIFMGCGSKALPPPPSDTSPPTPDVVPSPPIQISPASKSESSGKAQVSPLHTPDESQKSIAPNSLSFCFYNGQYMQQPYRLTIHGRELRLNGELILEYPTGPVANGKNLHQAELPELPASVNDKTTWDEILKIRVGISDWGNSYFRYFFSHYEPEDALQRARAAFAKLPFVASSEIVTVAHEFSGKRVLKVKTKSGDERDFLSTWSTRKERHGFDTVIDLPDLRLYSKQFILEQLNSRAAFWEESLREDSVFIVSDIGPIKISRATERRKWEEIVNVVEILNSSLPPAEKRQQIIQQISDAKDLEGDYDEGMSSYRILTELVEKFRPNEQLTSRIAKLKETVKVPLWKAPMK